LRRLCASVRRRWLPGAGPLAARSSAVLWSAAGRDAAADPDRAYYRIAGFERSIPFAGLALLLAALNGFATEKLGKRAPRPGLADAGALYRHRRGRGARAALTFALEKAGSPWRCR
jgi:hypothetical protein